LNFIYRASKESFVSKDRNDNFPKPTSVPLSPTHGRGRRQGGEFPRSYSGTTRNQDMPLPPVVPEESSIYSVASRGTDADASTTAYTVGKEITGTEDIDVS